MRAATNPRICWSSNSGVWQRRSSRQHYCRRTCYRASNASLGQGGRASALEVDELIAGDLALDDPSPLLGITEGLKHLRLIEPVPPHLDRILGEGPRT